MADIIPFPFSKFASPVDCPQVASSVQSSRRGSGRQAARQYDSTSSADVVTQAIVLCATSAPPPLSALPDSAWVIGTALRWINRRGKRRSAVPKLVLSLLERHVAAGDPAAQMFARWLDGDAPDRWSDHDPRLRTTSGVATEDETTDTARGGE